MIIYVAEGFLFLELFLPPPLDTSCFISYVLFIRINLSKTMRKEIVKGIVLFLAGLMFLSSPVQVYSVRYEISFGARRVKDVNIEHDEYGMATYYEFDQEIRRIKAVRDRNNNLIEEYLYDDSLPPEDALVCVKIRNITTGEWIELRRPNIATQYCTFNIYVEGKNVGDVSWDRYSEDTILVESIDVSGAAGEGVGSSVISWIAKYSQMQDGTDKIRCSTHNPIMLDAIAKVLLPEESIYTILVKSEEVHNLSESKMQILCNIGEFFIDTEGSADTFGEGKNRIIFDGGYIASSQWPQLPEGTDINRLGISGRWIVILDGKEIGQVKCFAVPLEIEGKTRPVRIYFDKDGQIIKY